MPVNPETHVSAHLRWSELHCYDRRTPDHRIVAVYPLDWRDVRARRLAHEFEMVRLELAAKVGQEVPLIVHSAYRTPEYNKAIGGAPRSQHVQGRALDVAPTSRRFLDELWEVAVARARTASLLRGVGRYDTFVHIDIRPTENLALWDYRSKK